MYDNPTPNRLNQGGFPRSTTILALVIAGCVLGVAGLRNASCAPGSATASADPRPITPRASLPPAEQATIDLFEQASRSVVYVSPMARRVRRSYHGYDTVIESGTGSGFIWDVAGHVVTNYHVIQDAERCRVHLPDNSTFEAEYVGGWKDKDIAVLRIDAPREKLHPIAVGTSQDLRVGQSVFAIGNPYGLDFTLTTGVVSALNREIRAVNGRTIQGVIQTDAAINPGNSGGPLLDSAGRLIGMNTTIYSKSGGYAGIGFAVPVGVINNVVPQLIASGRVTRPGLGIVPAPDGIGDRLGLSGVLIWSVAADSGAELAGLRPTSEAGDGSVLLGDVVLAVGDVPTPNVDALLNALERCEIGTEVPVEIERNGKRLRVPVTLQAID